MAWPMLRIRLLGEFSLDDGGAPLPAVNTARLQALLAYLIIHRDALQSRHHLAALFWPDVLAWIIHENIHRIGLAADGVLAGSQSPLWTPKSALWPLQPVYRGGCSAKCGQFG